MSSNEDDINDSDDSEMSQESWDDMSVDIIGKNCFYFYTISIK